MALADQLRLMVLTDAGLLKGRDPVEACRRAVAGGATIVEVRHKGAPARELAALARALVGALSVPVLVNDRVDVALAAGAAGAHLGQDDPPLDAVRPHGGARGRGLAGAGRARRGRWSVPGLVSDRVAGALAAGAAGAPVGQAGPPLDAGRRRVPLGCLLGASAGEPTEAPSRNPSGT